MKVFKFGGASLKDPAGVKNVAHILQKFKDEKLVVVVSAMGKTTNAMEEVIHAHAAQNGKALELLSGVKAKHYAQMEELFAKDDPVFEAVNDVFVEAEWVLEEPPATDFDFMYDQIIGIGELVSSKIVAAYLQSQGLKTQWLDARDIIATDETWREGWVIWDKTKANCKKIVLPLLEQGGLVVTQGFIGSTAENQTTSLGREGSDYSAAIFSHCLDAESMTIWKDVPGVLTADPRLFDNVVKLERLSYKEAIEMTYYGASVIHPKTIKPLQNKNIPMYVRSFIDPDPIGTEISAEVEDTYPPIVVLEKNQTLLNISTKDYSFVAEHHLAKLFNLLVRYRLIVNSMQNTAISFTIVVPNLPDRIDKFIAEIASEFTVKQEDGLELITVRHGNEDTIAGLKKGKVVLFEERIRSTVQMVIRNIPQIKRKEE